MRTTHNAQRTTHNLHACPNLDEKIHVALCVYDPSGNYSQHAGVVMTSIFENTSSPVMIHLLHDDTLTQDNREKFIRTAQKYSQEIEFHDLTEYREKLTAEMKSLAGRFTIGAFYKMFIVLNVPDVSKIIYLDGDAFVNLDIKELWDIDMEGKTLAGALDSLALNTFPLKGKGPANALRCKLYGGNYKSYINSGVLIMNLDKIRARGNFFELSKQWFKRYYHVAPSPDQDALNSMFYGDIKIIDGKFNRYNLGRDISNCIAHTWGRKPWETFAGNGADRLYWKMYLRSAWGEGVNSDEIIDKLGDLTDYLLYQAHSGGCRHSPAQCIKRICAYFSHHLVYHVIPIRVIGLLCSDIYHRIKYKFSR